MKKLRFCVLAFIFLILFQTSADFTQEKQQVTNPYAGAKYVGILNFKAVKLIQPVYPEPAKVARASGIVNVQVVIDEKGTVIAAQAFSGHPLLSNAAVRAAFAAKFDPMI